MNKRMISTTIQPALGDVALKLSQEEFDEATVKPIKKPGDDEHIYGWEVTLYEYTNETN